MLMSGAEFGAQQSVQFPDSICLQGDFWVHLHLFSALHASIYHKICVTLKVSVEFEIIQYLESKIEVEYQVNHFPSFSSGKHSRHAFAIHLYPMIWPVDLCCMHRENKAQFGEVLGEQKDLLRVQDQENKAAAAQLEADANMQTQGVEEQIGHICCSCNHRFYHSQTFSSRDQN